MGICLLTLWGTVFVLSIVCPIIMDPSSIGPNATFFMLSGFSFVACFYIFFVMKETYGLSDKKKKQLYMPGKFKEGICDE